MSLQALIATLSPPAGASLIYGLLAVFFIGYPLYSAWDMRRYRLREPRLSSAQKSAERLFDYRKTILILWSATALVALLFFQGELSAGELYLLPRFGFFGTGLALLGCAALLYQARGYATREQLRAQTRGQLGHVEPIMPRSRRELRWFYGLSLTAGLCEEVLFRGFLVAALTPALGFWGAALVATLAFGYGHIYQGGLFGFLRTASVGAVLMTIVYLSGSIWPAVLLHAVIDLVGGYIGFHCFKHETRSGARLEEAAATA